jgi:hypothetical protein
MFKNLAGQRVGAQMITAADGTPFTGAVTVYVTGDGGAQAVGSVGAGACVHEGQGFHTYAPAQAETNYDHIAFTFIATGAINATVQTWTRAGDAYTRLGAPAGASIAADIASVQTDTNDLQTRVPAALVGGRIDASVGAMAADVVTSSALAASAVTEIQSGLATAAALDAVDNFVDTEITAIQTTLGAAGAGLTAIPWNASWDAEVQSEVADALTAYDPPTNAEMEARTIPAANYATAANLATVAGYLDTEMAASLAILNKLDTTMELDGATYRFTVGALELAPTGGSAPTAAAIADEVQTRTIAGVTLVSGLAADAVTGAALAASAVAEIQSGLATATAVDALPTNAELATALAAADDATLVAIAAVQAAVNALPSAGTIASQVLSGQAMTESYADAGDTMSLAQAVYHLVAVVSNRRVQADVLRVYGLDGTTQVATFLLDDVTAPTEQIRQT